MNDFVGLPDFSIWSKEYLEFGKVNSIDFSKDIISFTLNDGRLIDYCCIDQVDFIVHTPFTDAKNKTIVDGHILQLKDSTDIYQVKWSPSTKLWVLENLNKKKSWSNIILSLKTNNLFEIIDHALTYKEKNEDT